MDKRQYRQGDIIQIAGLVFLGAGIGVELAIKAAIGVILITVGSVVFTIGTKLKGR